MKNEIAKHFDKNPREAKSKVAEALGISKQNLHYWLTIGKERPLTAELKAKVKALK